MRTRLFSLLALSFLTLSASSRAMMYRTNVPDLYMDGTNLYVIENGSWVKLYMENGMAMRDRVEGNPNSGLIPFETTRATSLVQRYTFANKAALEKLPKSLWEGMKLFIEKKPDTQGMKVIDEEKGIYSDGKQTWFKRGDHLEPLQLKDGKISFLDNTEPPVEQVARLGNLYDRGLKNMSEPDQKRIAPFMSGDQLKNARTKTGEDKIPAPSAGGNPTPSNQEPPATPIQPAQSKFCSNPVAAVCGAAFGQEDPKTQIKEEDVNQFKTAQYRTVNALAQAAAENVDGLAGGSPYRKLSALVQKVNDIRNQMNALGDGNTTALLETKPQLKAAEEAAVKAWIGYFKNLNARFDGESEKRALDAVKETMRSAVKGTPEEADALASLNKTELASFATQISEIEKRTDDDNKPDFHEQFNRLAGLTATCGVDGLAVNAFYARRTGATPTMTICPGFLLHASADVTNEEAMKDATHKIAVTKEGMQTVGGHELGHGIDADTRLARAANGFASMTQCLVDNFVNAPPQELQRNADDSVLDFTENGGALKEVIADVWAAKGMAVELAKLSDEKAKLKLLGKAYALFCRDWTPDGKGGGKSVPLGEIKGLDDVELPERPSWEGSTHADLIISRDPLGSHGGAAGGTNGSDRQQADGGGQPSPHPKSFARIKILLGMNPDVRKAMGCTTDEPTVDGTNKYPEYNKVKPPSKPPYCPLPEIPKN